MTKYMNLPERKNFLILGARYGTGNLGVDVLLSGSIRSILRCKPGAEIAVLDFGLEERLFRVPHDGSQAEVRLINLRFSWKLWLRNNGFRLLLLALLLRAIPVTGLRRWGLAWNPELAEIEETTVALSLAGGDSFSDIYGFRRLIYVSLPQLLVLAMGRPLVLLPQTLGPFKAGWARWIGRFILRRAKRVYSRDEASLELARDLLGPRSEHLHFSHDMGFALQAVPPSRIPEWALRKNRPLVGLNVSGLLSMGGYTGGNMFGLSGDYPELMRKIVRWFTSVEGADVVLVTHVTGDWEGDGKACAALYEELKQECGGQLHLADPAYDHREIKYLIGKCDFFLGARMHACIAALSQGIPAVGLAYSRKFAGVFESVNVPDLVVDLRSEGTEQTLVKIQQAYAERDRYREILKTSSKAAEWAAVNLISESGIGKWEGATGLPQKLEPLPTTVL